DNPFDKLTRLLDPLTLHVWEAETGRDVRKVQPFPHTRPDFLRGRNEFPPRGLSIGPHGQLLIASGNAPRDPLMDMGLGRRPSPLPGGREAAAGNATVLSF